MAIKQLNYQEFFLDHLITKVLKNVTVLSEVNEIHSLEIADLQTSKPDELKNVQVKSNEPIDVFEIHIKNLANENLYIIESDELSQYSTFEELILEKLNIKLVEEEFTIKLDGGSFLYVDAKSKADALNKFYTSLRNAGFVADEQNIGISTVYPSNDY